MPPFPSPEEDDDNNNNNNHVITSNWDEETVVRTNTTTTHPHGEEEEEDHAANTATSNSSSSGNCGNNNNVDLKQQGVHMDNLKRLLLFLEGDDESSEMIQDLGKKKITAVVELMKQNRTNPSILEECCWILYYESKHNPSFKRGVARLFQAIQEFPHLVNMHQAACAAIANVVQANPDASSRISPSSVQVLVNSLKLHENNTDIVQAVLRVLSLLDLYPSSLEMVSSLMQCVKHHLKNAELQGLGLHVLSNSILALNNFQRNHPDKLPEQPPTAILDVRLILRSFRQHNLSHSHSHSSEEDHGRAVAQYASQTLARALQTPHPIYGATPQIIAAAGGMEVLQQSLQEHIHHPNVQAAVLSALWELLKHSSQQPSPKQQQQQQVVTTPSKSFITSARKQKKTTTATTTEIAKAVIQCLQHNQNTSTTTTITTSTSTSNIACATAGLGVLHCLTTIKDDSSSPSSSNINNHLNQKNDWMMTGLETILQCMKEYPLNDGVILQGLLLLKHCSRQSFELQKNMVQLHGIPVVLDAMRHFLAKNHLDLQDAAFSTIRNLAAHPDHRLPIANMGGISTLVVTTTIFQNQPALQAYGCDALGRLAKSSSPTKNNKDRSSSTNSCCLEWMHTEHALGVAIKAMQQHPLHAGVVDRACFLLEGLLSYPPCLQEALKEQYDLYQLLLKAQVPAKPESTDRLVTLIQTLERHPHNNRKSWLLGRIRLLPHRNNHHVAANSS